MNKTIDIELAGLLFHMEEKAHAQLQAYLNSIAAALANTEGKEEIIREVEARLAELFQEALGESRQVVALDDVTAACAQIGSPEDFVDEEDAPKASAGNATGNRRLFRDPENGMIGGVATGMAHYFDADPVWVRVIALLVILFTGIGLPVYLVLWVITPKAETVADRMAMRGERATFENIKSRVQSEYERVENHLRDRRPGHQLAAFIREFFLALGKVVSWFFRGLGWVFLLSFVVMLFGLAFGVFALLTGWGDVVIDGINVGPEPGTVTRWMELVLPRGIAAGHLWMLALAFCALPLMLFAWLLLRLIFKSPLNATGARAGFVTASVITVCGLIGGGIIAGKTALEFREETTVKESFALPEGLERLVLRAEPSPAMEGDAPASFWVFREDEVSVPLVEVDILRTDGGVPELWIEKRAMGMHKPLSYQRAEHVGYAPTVSADGVIALPSVLSFPASDLYRGQHVEVTLMVPEGVELIEDASLDQLLHDVVTVKKRKAEDDAVDLTVSVSGDTLRAKIDVSLDD
ncbi:MAG: PspC domain-containing protein [Flavobacteriales bacterium]